MSTVAVTRAGHGGEGQVQGGLGGRGGPGEGLLRPLPHARRLSRASEQGGYCQVVQCLKIISSNMCKIFRYSYQSFRPDFFFFFYKI